MSRSSSVVLRLLGLLLLSASVLKGEQLLTEPVANNSIWTYRPFLVLQVECELALAVWFLSGLFRKAAWLAGLLCFTMFSAVTFYKGVTGAESCGCFGSVHVNTWITLFAIDVPAVIVLAVFRPKGERLLAWPSLRRFAATGCAAVAVLGVTTPILAFKKPAKIAPTYEVLEPETWVGQKLPILGQIDIAGELEAGRWVVMLYHYDCPDCGWAIPKYEQIARALVGAGDLLRVALIAVPPYGAGPVSPDTACVLGKLADTKEWFITTPAVLVLEDGRVRGGWEGKAPDLEVVVNMLVASAELTPERRLRDEY